MCSVSFKSYRGEQPAVQAFRVRIQYHYLPRRSGPVDGTEPYLFNPRIFSQAMDAGPLGIHLIHLITKIPVIFSTISSVRTYDSSYEVRLDCQICSL